MPGLVKPAAAVAVLPRPPPTTAKVEVAKAEAAAEAEVQRLTDVRVARLAAETGAAAQQKAELRAELSRIDHLGSHVLYTFGILKVVAASDGCFGVSHAVRYSAAREAHERLVAAGLLGEGSGGLLVEEELLFPVPSPKF